MDFRVLASGSKGNAYLVTDEGRSLLIEAGLPIKTLRRALNFKLSEVDGCLISHEHGDHARSATEVAAAGVTIYGSAGTKQELMVPAYRFKQMRSGVPYSVAGHWRILGFQAVHDAREPFGFLVEGPTGKLLYLSDSAFSPYRFAGLTHIALEANHSRDLLRAGVDAGAYPQAHADRVVRNHMGIEKALELLAANDLSRCEEIVLLHLSDGNSSESEFLEAVRRATGIPTYIAAGRATA